VAKLYRVTLTGEEREELEGITQRGSHKSQRLINALILLNCDEGEEHKEQISNEAVAGVLRVSTTRH
jgi:hypothetical protein